MPFLHGKGTQVYLDGKDLSAFLRSIDMTADVEAADVTTFSKNWKKVIPGLAAGSIESEGIADTTMQDIRQLLQASANSVLSWTPGGATAHGDPMRIMSVVEAKYKESAPVGDVVSFQWSVTGDDTLGFGNNLHLLAAETITGTGTAFPPSGGAQTLLGAVAHLHITAVSGSTPTLIVKFQDATTFGGAYTDITGGAFTVANAIGGQRLVIPGTIRQYVKAAWTITGGSPSFTFTTAFSRNLNS